MITTRFWVSPQGDIYEVKDSHLEYISENLKLFDLTIDKFISVFFHNNEPVLANMIASDKLIRIALKKGWMKISLVEIEQLWKIEIWRLNDKIRLNLKIWFDNIINKSENENKESYNVILIEKGNKSYIIKFNHLTDLLIDLGNI